MGEDKEENEGKAVDEVREEEGNRREWGRTRRRS